MAEIGKNILENITTGMYSDSRIMYREYIQNACDQIDKAIELDILKPGEGQVDIELDQKKRCIIITDNATGVRQSQFESQLGDIANSDKVRGEDKGFRGIGRLCGLAYCETLTFRTSYIDEEVESLMIIDAKCMREMLADKRKYTIDEVLAEIVCFKECPAEKSKHYFVVELDNINKENTDLLDKVKVEEYLGFVAPTPFPNNFIFRTKIYKHAEELQYHIDEYNIYVQGNQVFKNYRTSLYKESNSKKERYDEILDVEFKDFYSENGELVAWMWYGLSKFEGVIHKSNAMRGFRVRQGNIQIGESNILAPLFKEDRGNNYYIGEVYTAHRDLIPNSQRNNFNENETRILLEDLVRDYCYTTLHKIYNDASVYRKTYKQIDGYATTVDAFGEKEKLGFVNNSEKQSFESRLESAEKSKDEAKRKIEKLDRELTDKKDSTYKVRQAIKRDFDNKNTEAKVRAAEKKKAKIDREGVSGGYFTDSLSKLDKSKRKIIAQVLAIVSQHVSENALESIKKDIEKEYK